MPNSPQQELGFEDITSNSITIATPRKADVLCGRGKVRFHHEGNESFRMLIAEHLEMYKMATTKKLKMQVIELVVDFAIARGGRFLIQITEDTWVDGGIKQGKKKAGRAMRDALKGKVKCITTRESNHKALGSMNDESSLSSNSRNSSADEFDFDSNIDWLDEMNMQYRSILEPSRDWMHSKDDKEIANDLLDFFFC